MSMKWLTEDSSHNSEGSKTDTFKVRKTSGNVRKTVSIKSFFIVLVLFMFVTSGCALLPEEKLEEQLPSITPPTIAKKPEYTVTTDTIEIKVRGVGKIMSMLEEELFFVSDGMRIRDIYVQTGDYVTAGTLLAELDTTELENQLRQRRLQMRSRELAMIELLRKKDEIPPDELEQEKINFELERLKLVELEEEIERARLVAPFDGTIVSIQYNRGDQVQAYQTVMVISDLTKLTVTADISDSDLAKIAVGMDAIVDINAHGQFTGKVARLPVEKAEQPRNPWDPWYGGGNQPQRETIDDYVVIEIDGFPEGAARGTPLGTQIIAQRRENVVVIPPSALRTLTGRYYVQVVEEDGTKREVDVEIGQQTATQVEIIKGLVPGQKVVGR